MSTFDSTRVALRNMIRDITAGKVQLADFLRDWIWDYRQDGDENDNEQFEVAV